MQNTLFLKGVETSAFWQCTFDRWQPKIGDPHIMGWVTVVCYLITFVLCVTVFRKANPTRHALRVFWLALSVLMLFLAINKQLDLQSFATAGARCIAQLQGWYDNRHGFQRRVVIGMGVVAVLVGLYCLWMLRRDLRRNVLALLGMTIVFGFVLMRAVGFHDFDAIINTRISSIRMNWILELSGLFLISLNAILLLMFSRIHRRRRRRRRSNGEVYTRQTREDREHPSDAQ